MGKKQGSSGRFGARYGIRIRRRIDLIEKKQKSRHVCPYCSTMKVKRVSLGIYQCAKCKSKYTGGAYSP